MGLDAVADFDGDGIVDVVKTGASSGGLALYRGLGGGGFAGSETLLGPGTMYGTVEAGDLDGDGDLDLVAADSLAVAPFKKLVNDGSGRFSADDIPLPGGPSRTVRIADVNGDGVLDLVVARTSNGTMDVSWHEGQSGAFNGTPQPISSGIPGDVIVIDVDGDGLVDVASPATNSTLRVSFGLGAGAFGAAAPLSGPAETVKFPVTLADVDGDGFVEIFAVRLGTLRYYRATGPRLYAPEVPLVSGLDEINSTELLDLEGDGDLDLIQVSTGLFDIGPGLTADTYPFYQSAPGVFSPAPATSAAIPRVASAKDLNGDGLGDLIFETVEGLQWQLAGTGAAAGFFGPVRSTNLDVLSVSDHAMADLDQDGDPDTLLISERDMLVGWIENLGNGSYADPSVLLALDQAPTDVRALDHDLDGDIDLLVLRRINFTTTRDIVLFEDDGSGSFSQAGLGPTFVASEVAALDAMDFDGNGTLDVLLRLRNNSSWSTALFLGDGAGDFARLPDPLPFNEGSDEVQAGDLNGDGLPDLAYLESGPVPGRRIFVKLNLGGGAFSIGQSQMITGSEAWLSVVDLNQDGDLDAVTSNAGGLTLHAGDGTGTFQAGVPIGPSFLERAEFADLDADGDLDAYSELPLPSSGTKWAEQIAPGVFIGESALFAAGSVPRESLRLADLDGDGDQEAIVLNSGVEFGVQIRVYENGALSEFGESFCDAQPMNSTGRQGQLTAFGSESVDRNGIALIASALPANQFGLFVGSRAFGSPMPISNSIGLLCLTGAIGRYQGPGQIQSSGTNGSITLALDLQNLALPNGTVAGIAGESWSFQAWYRDTASGTATSLLTTGVAITLR